MGSSRLVHEIDQTQLERAVRRVPLSVPVRVRHDIDRAPWPIWQAGSAEVPSVVSPEAISCRLRLQYPPAWIGVVAGDCGQLGGSRVQQHVEERLDLRCAE